jgi:hypothetical protein
MMGPPYLIPCRWSKRTIQAGLVHPPDRIPQGLQIRREATGRPKVPCTPEIGFTRGHPKVTLSSSTKHRKGTVTL